MTESEKYKKLLALVKNIIEENSDDQFIFDKTEEIFFKDTKKPLYKSEFLCVLTKIKCQKLLEEIGEEK